MKIITLFTKFSNRFLIIKLLLITVKINVHAYLHVQNVNNVHMFRHYVRCSDSLMKFQEEDFSQKSRLTLSFIFFQCTQRVLYHFRGIITCK